jgi:hypothetical protein
MPSTRFLLLGGFDIPLLQHRRRQSPLERVFV